MSGSRPGWSIPFALTVAPRCDPVMETSEKLSWAEILPRDVTIAGNRIVYRLAGSGPVLLLVHGMAGSAETWKYVMPALAERFTVLAPDLLGQGESDTPDCDYSLETHAGTLHDLMAALGYDRATVVGQSLGGGMALQFAHDHPERCERLVLVNSGGLGPELTFYLRILRVPGMETVFPFFCTSWLRNAGDQVAAWLLHAGLKSTRADQEVWRSYSSLTDAGRRRAFFQSLRGVIGINGQTVSALGRIHPATLLPTLIVWGAQDSLIPVSHARALHQSLPGSRLEIFDGVGHYPHCEAPERFLALLVEFIGSTTPARLPPRNPQHDTVRRETPAVAADATRRTMAAASRAPTPTHE